MKVFGVSILIVGALLLIPFSAATPTGDLLENVYQADRVERLKLLSELSVRDFSSDAEKADWHNSRSREILKGSFAPYTEAVAVALHSDNIEDLLESLEASQ